MPYSTVEAQRKLGYVGGHTIRTDMDAERELELLTAPIIRRSRGMCARTEIVCHVCSQPTTVYDATLRAESLCLACWCERANKKLKEMNK